MRRHLSEKGASISDKTVSLRVVGAPRTKKNHGTVVWRMRKGKRHKYHVPSAAWSKWVVTAHIVGNHGEGCDEYEWPPIGHTLPAQPYNCAAVIYRDADRGDTVGYMQGLADLLEKRGVLVDDKHIRTWDGTRLEIDPKNPRVELTLTPLAA